jgi:hypothetical protein
MGSSQPATTTQTQNSTSTATPWSAATPLLQNLINQFGGVNTAMTPQQTAAGGQLQGAAQTFTDAAGNLIPQAQNVAASTGNLTPYGQYVINASGNLMPAAQNVAGSAGMLTPAAYQMMGAAQPQMPAAYNLMNAAGGVNALAPQSTAGVQQMFANAGMLPAAYQNLQQNVNPLANTANLNPYTTPGFSDALNTLTKNITSQVAGSYAGSGRDPSGAGTYAQSLGRGLMQGEAPIIQSQYNTNVANALSANQMLQNAGISTAGAMSGNTMQALQAAGMLPSLQMAPAQAQWAAAQAPLQAATAGYGAAGMPLQAALAQYGAAGQPLTAAQTQLQAALTPYQIAQTQYQAGQTPVQAAQGYYQAANAPWAAANMMQAQPFTNINPLLAAAMGLGGMGGTTTQQGTAYGTQTPANNPLSNILGGVTAGAGLLGSLFPSGGTAATALGPALMAMLPFSEREMKTDIKKVGKTHDKQNIYSFRLKGSPIPQIGMMADEVERKTPEAIVRDPATGARRVRYDLATRKAAQMGMMRAAA